MSRDRSEEQAAPLRPAEVKALPMNVADLTSTRQALAAKAAKAGFTVSATAFIGYDLPRWRRVHPDDPLTSYVADMIRGITVLGVRDTTEEHGLIGFTATWIWPAAMASKLMPLIVEGITIVGGGQRVEEWPKSKPPEATIKFAGWPARASSVTELNAELARLTV